MENQPTTTELTIRTIGEVMTVSSLDFANGLGIQHKNLLETIRTHQVHIEKGFGRIAFETRPLETGGGRQKGSVAYLTEDQALFVGTLSRNSERVVAFKTTLVKAFSEARKHLSVASGQQLAQGPNYENILLQQGLLLDAQQEQIRKMTQQLNAITASLNPIQQAEVQVPQVKPNDSTLREIIINHVNRYIETRGFDQQDTWHYLFKRLLVQNGINVRQLYRSPGSTDMDALEKHGLLDKLHAIVATELSI